MPTAHALKVCPNLILVPPDRALYRRLHEQMRQVTDRFFPATEWSSIDEFYADATDLQLLHPYPAALGRTVKDALFEATGLRCTIAVATSKPVARFCESPSTVTLGMPTPSGDHVPSGRRTKTPMSVPT